MTSGLIRQLEDSLVNLRISPWLPELTTKLAATGWEALYRNTKLSPSEYGTARVMARNASAQRRILTFLPIALNEASVEHVIQIETLGQEFTAHYEEAGIRLYSMEEIRGAQGAEQLRDAINILKHVPTLFQTVALLVKSIHLIDASVDEYDVSFSEPHIPFSIFVSIPRSSSFIGLLRIVEAIVHEAMHLQLTLVEQLVPLVIPSSQQYFSPWKGEYRSPQGILHALYVFRVIDRFLEVLMLSATFPNAKEHYLYNRRDQIAMEIEQVKLLQGSSELTPIGAKFVQALLSSQ